MTQPIYFAPLRTPVTDADGLMSRQWYLFFQALWMRAGGSIDPAADDAFVAPSVTGIDSSQVYDLAASFGQMPQFPALIPVDTLAGEIAELRAIVTQQGQMIQDLRQGQVVL